MNKMMILVVVFLFAAAFTYGQKPGVGKFSSAENIDKVFTSALRAVTAIKFTVKNTDRVNGTIQAENYISNGKFLNLFVVIRQDGGKTIVEATFTKPFAVIGKMSNLAKKYGEEIKKTIVDLDIQIDEKE
jgi:hypothetical protein